MLRSMPLDSTDAYVLSRIDGVTLAHEIVDACGLDAKGRDRGPQSDDRNGADRVERGSGVGKLGGPVRSARRPCFRDPDEHQAKHRGGRGPDAQSFYSASNDSLTISSSVSTRIAPRMRSRRVTHVRATSRTAPWLHAWPPGSARSACSSA